MYRGKIMDKYAICARLSMIQFMHDTVTKLDYTSRNRVNFAYTNDFLL